MSRILCFRLKENISEVKQPASKIVDFAKDLSEAIVSGATDIQQSLQDGIYTIDIDTGDVKSTDFKSIDANKKEILFQAGRSEVIEFIKNERINLKQVFSHFVLKGYDEMLFSVIQGLRSSNDFFCAVGISTFWISLIFPIVLNSARRGVAINIITTVTTNTDELKRRKLLEGLGANIFILDKAENIPFTGFLFDPDLDSGIAVLCNKSGHVGVDYSYNEGDSRIYYREKDSSLISLLFSLLKKHDLLLKQDKLNIPYVICDEEDVFNKLRSVSQYKSCRFELKEIDISDEILVLQRNVKEFKMLQILTHIRDLESSHCTLFYPQKVKLIGGEESFVVPPIFEVSGDKLILIDGNSRLFYCLKNNVKKIYVIIVHGVEGSLPSTPVSIKELGLISSTISLNENMESFIKSNFRKIEDAVRS